jgi:hypothetical protein
VQHLELAFSADKGRTGYRSRVHIAPNSSEGSEFVHLRSFPPYRTSYASPRKVVWGITLPCKTHTGGVSEEA